MFICSFLCSMIWVENSLCWYWWSSLYINFLLIILILKVKKKLFTENFNFFLYGEVLVIPTYLLKREDSHQFISIIFNLSRFQLYCVGPSVLLITNTFDLFVFPHLLTLIITDEGYYRIMSCTVNLISKFLDFTFIFLFTVYTVCYVPVRREGLDKQSQV